MRFLLDTHFIVWWLDDSPRMGAAARKLIATGDCAVSVISLMELRLKIAAGKMIMPKGVSAHRQLEAEGFALLPMMPEHVEESARFENAHADIYDRILLGAAACERRVLLTRDAALLALAKANRLAFVREA